MPDERQTVEAALSPELERRLRGELRAVSPREICRRDLETRVLYQQNPVAHEAMQPTQGALPLRAIRDRHSRPPECGPIPLGNQEFNGTRLRKAAGFRYIQIEQRLPWAEHHAPAVIALAVNRDGLRFLNAAVGRDADSGQPELLVPNAPAAFSAGGVPTSHANELERELLMRHDILGSTMTPPAVPSRERSGGKAWESTYTTSG